MTPSFYFQKILDAEQDNHVIVVDMNNTLKHGICITRIAEDKRVMGWSVCEGWDD